MEEDYAQPIVMETVNYTSTIQEDSNPQPENFIQISKGIEDQIEVKDGQELFMKNRVHLETYDINSPELKQELLAQEQFFHTQFVNQYGIYQKHKQIVRVVEYCPYNLKQYLEYRRYDNQEELLNICSQLIQFVQDLHKNQIYHRNICPKNILITFNCRNEIIVKLTEFQLATVKGEQSKSQFRPQQRFSSIEQSFDAYEDIWALGMENPWKNLNPLQIEQIKLNIQNKNQGNFKQNLQQRFFQYWQNKIIVCYGKQIGSEIIKSIQTMCAYEKEKRVILDHQSLRRKLKSRQDQYDLNAYLYYRLSEFNFKLIHRDKRALKHYFKEMIYRNLKENVLEIHNQQFDNDKRIQLLINVLNEIIQENDDIEIKRIYLSDNKINDDTLKLLVNWLKVNNQIQYLESICLNRNEISLINQIDEIIKVQDTFQKLCEVDLTMNKINIDQNKLDELKQKIFCFFIDEIEQNSKSYQQSVQKNSCQPN